MERKFERSPQDKPLGGIGKTPDRKPQSRDNTIFKEDSSETNSDRLK